VTWGGCPGIDFIHFKHHLISQTFTCVALCVLVCVCLWGERGCGMSRKACYKRVKSPCRKRVKTPVIVCHEWVKTPVWVSENTGMSEWKHRYEWVKTPVWVSENTGMSEWKHRYEWVKTPVWVSENTGMSEWKHRYEWVKTPVMAYQDTTNGLVSLQQSKWHVKTPGISCLQLQ